MKNSVIKKSSKNLIKGKRFRALSITFFSFVFCVLSTAVSLGIMFFSELYHGVAVTVVTVVVLVLLGLFALFVYSSASVGEKAWYNGIAGKKANYSKRLFYWFKPKNSLRAFGFRVTIFFIKLFWAVVFFLPCLILLWSVYYLSGTGGLELYLFFSLSGGSILLAIGGTVFYFAAMQRYFIAEYLFSSDPRLDAITAIRQSKNLLDGHLLEIVRFKLSFLPWFLSCVFVFPAFYFIPYYKQSCSMVAKKITL